MGIADGQEVATYIDVDQFQPDKSVDTCGFTATALNDHAAERGHPYGASAAEVLAQAAAWYTQYDGPDVPANHNGMALAQLYRLIIQIGRHFQNLYPDGGVAQDTLKNQIRFWLHEGFPVLLAIEEPTVQDFGLGRGNPYAWDTADLTHIITATGVADGGMDFLVRDTANVGRPGPRTYAQEPLSIISATVFVPSWLPRPLSATKPAPLPEPPPSPPVTRAQLQGLFQNLLEQVTKL